MLADIRLGVGRVEELVKSLGCMTCIREGKRRSRFALE